ncbi:MAG: GNAT family N-acetyltransferase [Clostridia bacterium]|nr:GNAT family N-acetyltransferase [Clostridia bacterium]
MIQYRLANDKDMDRIIDFINMVFSMLRVPHNFETMLPKVYGKDARLADIHVIAEEEDGRLCGCLGMYEFPLRIGDATLRVGYLGSMAVHPRVRGQGTMGTLMQKQIERGVERGLDLMVLGGQRQRYQYSGFETGGATYLYSISRANVRHALVRAQDEGMVFAPMTQEDVPAALAIYNRQMVAGARRQDNFIATLVSYHKRAWSVKRDGVLIGYFSAAVDHAQIGELVMAEDDMVLPAIKAWMNAKDVRLLHVAAAPHDATLNRLLALICESCSITPNCMIRVLKPENVLPAYMKLKGSYEPLENGELILGWEGLGAYRLCVEESSITVEKTDKEPEIQLSGIEMHRLLFGHNRFGVPQAGSIAPRSWFPLPLHIAEPDSF